MTQNGKLQKTNSQTCCAEALEKAGGKSQSQIQTQAAQSVVPPGFGQPAAKPAAKKPASAKPAPKATS